MSNKLQIEHVDVCLYRNGGQTLTGFRVFDDLSHFPVTEFASRDAVPGDLPSVVDYCHKEGLGEALGLMQSQDAAA